MMAVNANGFLLQLSTNILLRAFYGHRTWSTSLSNGKLKISTPRRNSQWHIRVGNWWVHTQFLCPLTALSNIVHRILEAPVRHWALLVCSDKITLLWLVGPFSNWCFLGSSFWETVFTKIFVSGYAYDKTYFHESINIYIPISFTKACCSIVKAKENHFFLLEYQDFSSVGRILV